MEKNKVYIRTDDGNTKLPYGLAMGLGLDVDGLSPKEVWEVLKEYGVYPYDAFNSLENGESGGQITEKVKEESGSKDISYPMKAIIQSSMMKPKEDGSFEFSGYNLSVDDLYKLEEGTVITGIDKYGDSFKYTKTAIPGKLLDENGEKVAAYDAGIVIQGAKGKVNARFVEHSKEEVKDKTKGKNAATNDEIMVQVEERMGQFEGARKYSSAREADEALREECGDIWKSLPEGQKNSLYEYTGIAYEDINNSLVGKNNVFSSQEENIQNMTDAIQKSELSRDTVLYRGVGNGGFAAMFGLTREDASMIDAEDLVGLTGTNEGFSSCGSSSGTGFTTSPVQMRVLCPKGTKAIYAEPWSENGDGSGIDWDGEESQNSFSNEDETILQRGTQFQIIRARRDAMNMYIDVAVISQKPKELKELKRKYGW